MIARLFTSLIAACLLVPTHALANPLDTYELSARGVGMAGALAALAEGVASTHYNPAALTLSPAVQLELGYLSATPHLRLNGHDLAVDGAHGFQGGLVVPGDLWGHRVSAGVVLHLPNERITRLRALPESQPRFALYDNHPQRVVLTTAIAFEILPKILSFGAGLTYLTNTRGSLDLEGIVDFADADGTTLLPAVDVDFQAARTLSLGLLWRPTPAWRVALTFHDAFDLSLDLAVRVRGDIVSDGASEFPNVLVENATLDIATSNANLFTPRQLILGLAYSHFCTPGAPRPLWSATAELAWQQWSLFASPTSWLRTSIDAPGIPLAIPKNPLPLAPGFHDILLGRAAFEGWLLDSADLALALRAGLAFLPSPAPPQRGKTQLIDNAKLTVGLGATFGFKGLAPTLPRPLWLDLGVGLTTLIPRTHSKLDPADLSGDMRSTGTAFTWSATLRLELGAPQEDSQ